MLQTCPGGCIVGTLAHFYAIWTMLPESQLYFTVKVLPMLKESTQDVKITAQDADHLKNFVNNS